MTASPKEMRAWLRANGVTVGDRGRLHPDAIRKYNRAHAKPIVTEPVVPAKPGKVTYTCGWCGTGDCYGCVGDNYCKCAIDGHKEKNGK